MQVSSQNVTSTQFFTGRMPFLSLKQQGKALSTPAGDAATTTISYAVITPTTLFRFDLDSSVLDSISNSLRLTLIQ